MTSAYIPRHLTQNEVDLEKTISEKDFVEQLKIEQQNKRCVVILAEPGAGKTDLLFSFSKQLDAELHYASILVDEDIPEGNILIVDALDEVSTTDPTRMKSLLGKIFRSNAQLVILSCRATEWEHLSNESHIKRVSRDQNIEFINRTLKPLDYLEIQQFYSDQKYSHSFESFIEVIEQNGLYELIGNPIILKILAKVFNSHEVTNVFESKSRIFEQAVREFASEQSDERSTKYFSLSLEEKIAYIENIFAVLLLSGSVGISIQEKHEDQDFPRLQTIINNTAKNEILNNTLFKPQSAQVEVYIPVHRIIAEYCSANFLRKELEKKSNPLSLSRLLAIIAPNSTVRNELRGMFGWLVALCGESIQLRLIEIDSYAVLAYGDAANLSANAKKRLLECLSVLGEQDPYFRRSDDWRTLSISNFIDENLVVNIQENLDKPNVSNHFKILILELLRNSNPTIIMQFSDELNRMALEGGSIASLSYKSLLKINDSKLPELVSLLLDKNTNEALQGALYILKHISSSVEDGVLFKGIELSRKIAYRVHGDKRGNNVIYADSIYLEELLTKLSLQQTINIIQYLLPLLSESVQVREKRYSVNSELNGTSIILLILLNQYLQLKKNNFDFDLIWSSLKNIRLANSGNYRLSENTSALLSHLKGSNFRENILDIALEDPKFYIYREDYYYINRSAYSVYIYDDIPFILNFLFEQNNPKLWVKFYLQHAYSNKKPNEIHSQIRKIMKEQAKQNMDFMKEWIHRERYVKAQSLRDNLHWQRLDRRYERERQLEHLQILADFNSYKIQIQKGEDFHWLGNLARCYLSNHDELAKYCTIEFAEEALINALTVFNDDIPTIDYFLQVHYERKYLHIEEIICAACFALFQRDINKFDLLPKNIIFILKFSHFRNYVNNSFDDELVEQYKARINIKLLEHFTLEEIFDLFYAQGGTKFAIEELICKSMFNPIIKQKSYELLTESTFFSSIKSYMAQLFGMLSTYDSMKVEEVLDRKIYGLQNFIGAKTFDQQEQEKFWILRAFTLAPKLFKESWDLLMGMDNPLGELKGYIDNRFKDYDIDLDKSHIDPIVGTFINNIVIDAKKKAENNYRNLDSDFEFLRNIVWRIDSLPTNEALTLSSKFLKDNRFDVYNNELKSINFNTIKRQGLEEFSIPQVSNVVKFFKDQSIVTVEDLRARTIEVFEEYQIDLNGSETNPKKKFYDSGKHVNENTARDRIVEDIKNIFHKFDASVNIESYMADDNRCDITIDKVFNGKQSRLVIEVKGQWHEEVFTAAEYQLNAKYSIHPNASQQGIYLVLWFGSLEKVANRKLHGIKTAQDLKNKIEEKIPKELHKLIDVVVLDVSLTSDKN